MQDVADGGGTSLDVLPAKGKTDIVDGAILLPEGHDLGTDAIRLPDPGGPSASNKEGALRIFLKITAQHTKACWGVAESLGSRL
jgi:hypothetical protein